MRRPLRSGSASPRAGCVNVLALERSRIRLGRYIRFDLADVEVLVRELHATRTERPAPLP